MDANNLTLSLNASDPAFTLIAQSVTCGYPISDLYAKTPRFLYYGLLALSFLTLRYRWLSHVFVGAAATYAFIAGIHAIIIVSRPANVQDPQNVTIPYLTADPISDPLVSLVNSTSELEIQPDAVELDIDAITAIVVTAYIVGLPLQLWSRTIRSRMIIRYMLMTWNAFMLAAAICALVAWPGTDLASPQYRFCFAGFLDPSSQTNGGWDPSVWEGDWNSTIWSIFNGDGDKWQQLTDNCLNPCFNTSQTLRQASALKAVVISSETTFAKIHAKGGHEGSDVFAPFIYLAIAIFSAASVLLILASYLPLNSPWAKQVIQDPFRLWKEPKKIWGHVVSDAKSSWRVIVRGSRLLFHRREVSKRETDPVMGKSASPTGLFPLRLILDMTALASIIISLLFFPVVVIAFICWIEWYIRNDGATNETISQVGQWSPVVSIAVVLISVVVYQLKDLLATPDELRHELEEMKERTRQLEEKLNTRVDVELNTLSQTGYSRTPTFVDR